MGNGSIEKIFFLPKQDILYTVGKQILSWLNFTKVLCTKNERNKNYTSLKLNFDSKNTVILVADITFLNKFELRSTNKRFTQENYINNYISVI